MAISPGPGRAAAAEGVKGWVADLAWLCSQPVDLGEGATGAGRRADREVYLRVRESVARAPDHSLPSVSQGGGRL
jgi:hypothetical protein